MYLFYIIIFMALYKLKLNKILYFYVFYIFARCIHTFELFNEYYYHFVFEVILNKLWKVNLRNFLFICYDNIFYVIIILTIIYAWNHLIN